MRRAAQADRHLVADPGVVGEAGDLEGGGADRGDAADAAAVRDPRELGPEGGEVGKHRQGLTKAVTLYKPTGVKPALTRDTGQR